MTPVSPEAKEAADIFRRQLVIFPVQTYNIEHIERAFQDAIDASHAPAAWVKCSDRLPTERDADNDGKVWVWSTDYNRPFRIEWTRVADDLRNLRFAIGQRAPHTHWQPTGLRRPAAPTAVEEAK